MSMKEAVEILKRSKKDPIFFVKNVLGISTLWEKQEEILLSIRDNKYTSVRSCHGSGKTFTAACAVVWFLLTHPYSIVITTAPTDRQVKELLWQEIARLARMARIPIGGQLLTKRWSIDAGWFALGFSSDETDKFQGYHAKDLLVVVDEACGVAPAVYEGIDSILTSGDGNKLLLIGNPTEPSGRFYDSFKSPLYYKVHISAFDTPNLKAGRIVNPFLVTPQWVEERRLEWGENSPLWKARVLGEFPEQGADTFISLADVDKALDNDLYASRGIKDSDIDGPCVVAVDPARFGDDESIIVVRRGWKVTRLHVFNALDTVQLAREVLRVMLEEKPQLTVIDTVGIGSGTFDVLFREYGVTNVVGFVSQERANDPSHYVNRRAEAWDVFKNYLRRGKIDLTNFQTPREREIIRGQFGGPRYEFDSAGRLKLESKEDMKKRGLKSPNRADAIVMSFYFDGTSGVGMATWPSERVKKPEPGTVGYLLDKLNALPEPSREEIEILGLEEVGLDWN